MTYRFRKLYSDLVTDDGTVVVAYVAWLDLFGGRSTYAGVELYTPDGARDVIRAQAVSHRADAAGVEIELEIPSGRFVMSQRTIHGAWRPSGRAAHGELDWSVVCARAASEVRFEGGRVLRGIGYADWVEVGCPTRRLGLAQLRWGRVHLPESTVVFNDVRFRDGESWSRAAEWSAAGARELEGGSLVRDVDHDVVVVPREQADEAIHVERARTLHAGDPIDPQRFPGFFERAVCGLITGPANEDRRLSRAHVTSWGPESAGWALHETVRFGQDEAA